MNKVLAVIVSSCFIVSIQGMDGERIKENLYKILRVTDKATYKEIRKAYYKLARKYHPDKNKKVNCAEKMKKLNAAYAILKDKDKRKAYDTGKLFGSFLDDMMEDMMGEFGVDTYDETKDEDFAPDSDEEMYGSSEDESCDSDNDVFVEEKYQQQGAYLMAQWKAHYRKTMGDEDDEDYQPKLLNDKPEKKRHKRFRKVKDGRKVNMW